MWQWFRELIMRWRAKPETGDEMGLQDVDLCFDFIVVDENDSAQTVRNRLEDNVWQYLVMPIGSGQDQGQYRIFMLGDVIDALKVVDPHMVGDSRWRPLKELPQLSRFTTTEIDKNSNYTIESAKKLAIDYPHEAIVVLDRDEVYAVVAPDAGRSAQVFDLDYLPVIAEESQPATLSTDDESAPEIAASEAEIDPRIVNVELLDKQQRPMDARKEALTVAEQYLLSFFVDVKASEHTIVPNETTIPSTAFEANRDSVILTIRLESDDFDIPINEQLWSVPKTGTSPRTTFAVTPLADGPASISAIILKDGQFVQALTLKFFVGQLFTMSRTGHALNASLLPQKRDLNITILNTGDGYQMVMSSQVTAMAKLPINDTYLHSMIADLRKKLRDQIVYYATPANERIFQTQLNIPTGVADDAMKILAEAGYDLFLQLFYGPGHSLQANLLGDTLRRMATDGELNIQIFAQNFPLPWGLLYVDDDIDNPKPEHFLGLKHVIESIPLQPTMAVTSNVIDTERGLRIGLNVNKDIDKQMNRPIIARQIDFWKGINFENSDIRATVRETSDEVSAALKGSDPAEDILYFYCHAITYNLDEEEKGGPERSRMIFTGKGDFSLKEARRDRKIFNGNPLVFINACETAKLSPEFYDGFVPYFMRKGARGVIGTECEAPALFAEEFAKEFFNRFLQGNSTLGEIFLELRKEFMEKNNNMLGLLYALYVDGDTKISRPLLD